MNYVRSKPAHDGAFSSRGEIQYLLHGAMPFMQMQKLLVSGRLMFVVAMLALAALCFSAGEFVVGRPPAWPDRFHYGQLGAYIAATLLAVASVLLAVRIKARLACFAIAVILCACSLTRELWQFPASWLAACKTLALAGGAIIMAVPFLSEVNHRRLTLSAGCFCLAVFFIASGYAHFKYAGFVIGFIPSYIPFHPFWTYFCGVCLAAGGIGILLPPLRRWAALWSGIMVSGWFLLLHIPRFLSHPRDMSDRMGLCESFAFAGIFFVLAAITQKPETISEDTSVD